MSHIKVLLLAWVALFSASAGAQKSDISSAMLKKHVTFLASDSLEGRKPGTAGMKVAASYIRDQFKADRLTLICNDGFQYFEILIDVKPGVKNGISFPGFTGILKQDFIPLSFSSNGTLNAPVVFVGYGLSVDQDSLQWNDYQGVDVKGKWVMVFRGDPEPNNLNSKFIPFGSLWTKVLNAKDHGAAGILFVTPKGMDEQDKLIPLVAESNEMTSGIPLINISRSTANIMLKTFGQVVDSLEQTMMKNKNPKSFNLGITVNATVDVMQKREKTANVVALLEGSDPVLKNEFLVIGAHYDHLGFGGPGSGSRMPDTIAIHNGADDNASGTAMLLELARKFGERKDKLKRSIIFVAFSGEEMGLLGSKYFANNPPVELKKIKAMFNFDMLGRFDKDKNSIMVGGTGTSMEIDSLLKTLEGKLPFKVAHAPDGYGPSDHAAFYAASIPVLYFNAGVHTDYHTPFDDTEKLDFDTEKIIGDFAAEIITVVGNLDKPLAFRESGRKEGSGRTGRQFKVKLGIMPDFAGMEKRGLRVDGVTKDGPGDKGGLKKGDIIIGINGMKVGNIEEYMSRLMTLKHGMTVSIEVIREGKNEVLLIQL